MSPLLKLCVTTACAVVSGQLQILQTSHNFRITTEALHFQYSQSMVHSTHLGSPYDRLKGALEVARGSYGHFQTALRQH